MASCVVFTGPWPAEHNCAVSVQSTQVSQQTQCPCLVHECRVLDMGISLSEVALLHHNPQYVSVFMHTMGLHVGLHVCTHNSDKQAALSTTHKTGPSLKFLGAQPDSNSVWQSTFHDQQGCSSTPSPSHILTVQV